MLDVYSVFQESFDSIFAGSTPQNLPSAPTQKILNQLALDIVPVWKALKKFVMEEEIGSNATSSAVAADLVAQVEVAITHYVTLTWSRDSSVRGTRTSTAVRQVRWSKYSRSGWL